MAKNTGRGSRNAAPVRGVRPDTTWIKHNSATGIFSEAKARGGSFEGLRPPRNRARLWNMKTKILVLAATTLALVLTGCGQPATAGTVQAPQTDIPGGNAYYVSVTTPQGSVPCIVSDISYGGGISCDWDALR